MAPACFAAAGAMAFWPAKAKDQPNTHGNKVTNTSQITDG